MWFIQIITFFNPDFEDWAFDSRSHCSENVIGKIKTLCEFQNLGSFWSARDLGAKKGEKEVRSIGFWNLILFLGKLVVE